MKTSTKHKRATIFRTSLPAVYLVWMAATGWAQCPTITCPGNISVYTCNNVVTYTTPAGFNSCACPSTITGFGTFSKYTAGNGNCYALSNGATDWLTARDACATAGGHLATIGSAGENTFVNGVAGTNAVWIGFTDGVTEGTWKWVTNEPAPYTNWNTGEPNNSSAGGAGGEDCAEMISTGTWNDLGYTFTTLRYVLEIGVKTVEQTAGLPSGAAFPIGTTTNTFRVTHTNGQTAECSFTVTVNNVPGNPAVFGNNTWNVYGYSGGDITLTGTYYGYYTESNVSYNTLDRWSNTGSPSDASGWQGCVVPVDNHVVVSKRQGFPAGTYTFSVPSHDDRIQVYINGTLRLDHTPCCDAHCAFWTETLGPASTIEVRHQEVSGGSQQALSVIPNPTLPGDGVWWVYGYNGGNIDLTGSTLRGYYIESNLSYSTTNRWGTDLSPSSASIQNGSGWQGCTVDVDQHAVVSKRKGFPCGYYRLDFSHDDNGRVYIDGVQVYNAGCCNNPITNIWTGHLGPASTIEVRTYEGGGLSYQGLTFNQLAYTYPTPGAVTSNSPQCDGTGITFTQGTCPSGYTCYWVSSATGTETANSNSTYTTATTAGAYIVWVRARNNTTGCWTTAMTASGTVRPMPTFTYTKTDITCFNASNGTITVNASGGSGTYEYSKDGGSTWQSSNQFTGLGPGNYPIVVKDSYGCVQPNCP
jgi:hypothetical protein